SPAGVAQEALREAARALGERDPLVRRTAQAAALTIAVTPETAERVQKIGATNVVIKSQVALSDDLLRTLQAKKRASRIRVLSVGHLSPVKAFHLGIHALARSGLDAEYFIIGDGPERRRLEQLALRLDLQHRVRFLGRLPHEQTIGLMRE